MEPNQTNPQMEPDQKSNGALIGSVIIIIILIIGGIYFWKTSLKNATQPVINNNSVSNSETTNSTSTFPEEDALEADLGNIDMESLDQGI